MLKKLFSLLTICFLVLSVPNPAFADDLSRTMVEQIIAGGQDYLVFASIVEKGSSAYEVQVIEEIGAKSTEADDKASSDADSDKDTKIFVEGFEKYMYYDNNDYRPQKGDNVLLSLKFNGNSYTIQNGAFRVDSTSHEQFKFMMPDKFKSSEEALELSALYIYIYSNGETKDLTIKDGAIYGKDANGAQQKIEINDDGIEFLDEFGDTSEKPSAVELYGQTPQKETHSKWPLALIIIVVGAFAGPLFVNIIKKFEKRYD